MSSARQSDDRRETSNRWREIAGHSRTPAIWAPLSAIADALMFLAELFRQPVQHHKRRAGNVITVTQRQRSQRNPSDQRNATRYYQHASPSGN